MSEADENAPLELPSEKRLPIIPHYLKHPPLADRVEMHDTRRTPLVQEKFSTLERVPLPDGRRKENAIVQNFVE